MLALPQRLQITWEKGGRMGFTEVHKWLKAEQKRSERVSSQGYRFKSKTPRLRKVSQEKWGKGRQAGWMAEQEVDSGFLLQLPASSRARRAPCSPSPARQALRLSTRPSPLILFRHFSPEASSPPQSTLSKTEDNAERKAPREQPEPSVLTSWSRRPGLIPMATPPSAGSNARADARAPAVPHSPPMSIEGTRGTWTAFF